VNRFARILLATLFVVAWFPAQPATAQAGRGGQGPVVNSWALAPTGTDPANPSSRVYLSYSIPPGTTVRDSVTLWNYSNVPLTFQLYATDAFTNGQGSFDLLPSARRPSDAGSWVTLEWNTLTVRANAKVDIPFTLTVPTNGRPGDHAGAVLAANQVQGTESNGKVVNLDRRTGSRLYVRVTGPLNPVLVIDNIHAVYHASVNPLGGSLDVTYTVRNAGNVRLGAHQLIAASGPFGVGRKTRLSSDLAELLPNNAVTRHERFHGVPALLRASGAVTLHPFSAAADVKVSTAIHASAHTWALPWSVLVVVLGLWLARRTYVPIARRRREIRGSMPEPGRQLTPVP
jgi:hypothetical protein